MKLNLHIWRQKDKNAAGQMKTYTLDGVEESMSFLEMLDLLNEQLIAAKDEPVNFDHDCREGICGACSLVINGTAHGPQEAVTTCQLHMRSFKGQSDIYIEPWRAKAFPVVKDLVVDRSAFDRIIQAGGFISVNAGGVVDANTFLISKNDADKAMDAAACIGCGACVAQCKNASAMLFVGAKVAHLASLPQGQVEKKERVLRMVKTMQDEGFGNCTNTLDCEAVCPKSIGVSHIAKLHREFLAASLTTTSNS